MSDLDTILNKMIAERLEPAVKFAVTQAVTDAFKSASHELNVIKHYSGSLLRALHDIEEIKTTVMGLRDLFLELCQHQMDDLENRKNEIMKAAEGVQKRAAEIKNSH